MIIIPTKEDTKVFNMKTFRDPLSNVIEISPKSHYDPGENFRKKETVYSKSILAEEFDCVKIWNPRSIHR